jgi:hypothetical protein
MIANGDGHVIGHPDEARLDTDVSAYPVVRAALQGRTTDAISVNLAGVEMLMVGQPLESPSTLHPRPWVGLNKEFGTTILTDSTWEAVREGFECRAMPEAPLKGKTKVPRVFEVVSARVGSSQRPAWPKDAAR